MGRVLVTGATGFVGRHLVPMLLTAGWELRAALRSRDARAPGGCEPVVVGDLARLPDAGAALAGVDVVVHLAGRAHVMRETAGDPESEFRRVNAEATRHLAEQAARAGARRFVFLSTVKVNGERSFGRAFTEADAAAPEDAYGRSKWLAEQALHEVSRTGGLEVAAIRPPLVYGPGVKANFLRLLRLIDKGVPLPFGGVRNLRSLVSVWNLCDLVTCCVGHPAAAGETFLVSDQRDLSTPELIRAIADVMGRPARLLPVPEGVLRWASRLLRQGDVLDRLIGSLQVDSSKATRLLGWTPRLSVEDGLRRTAAWYLESRGVPR
jgi:nucleoside-diphosphate-sugar epimerase